MSANIKSQILNLLEDGEPRTIHQIAKALGRPVSTWLRNAVTQLYQDSFVIREQRVTTGRPAFTYRGKNKELMTPRQQWQKDVTAGRVVSYQVWLELQVERLQARDKPDL